MYINHRLFTKADSTTELIKKKTEELSSELIKSKDDEEKKKVDDITKQVNTGLGTKIIEGN
jgi:hypothetical protein